MAKTSAVELSQDNVTSLLDAESLPFAVALIRANDGKVVFANHLMSVIIRCPANEMVGSRIVGLFDDGKQRSEIFKLLKKSNFVPPKQINIRKNHDQSLNVTVNSSLLKFQN